MCWLESNPIWEEEMRINRCQTDLDMPPRIDQGPCEDKEEAIC